MNIELKITLWALACAYALVNSFIYSWTFWTAFDVNILQFASISDIIPSIIYTLTIPFILVILSMVSNEIWVRFTDKVESIIDDLLGSHIKNYNKIKSTAIILTPFIFCIVIGVACILIVKSSPARLPSDPIEIKKILKLVTPFIIAFIAIYFIIFKTKFLSPIKYRRVLIFCICFLPVTSYIWAIANSTDILLGRNTLLVKSDTQCKSSDNTKYRYISSISDKAFALSLKDGSICIFKYNQLELIPEEKAQFTEALDSRML